MKISRVSTSIASYWLKGSSSLPTNSRAKSGEVVILQSRTDYPIYIA